MSNKTEFYLIWWGWFEQLFQLLNNFSSSGSQQKYFVIISVFRIKIDFNVCVKRLLIELLIENNLLNKMQKFSQDSNS